jgi:hypothetical protein
MAEPFIIYQGAIAPEAYKARIAAGKSGVDMTTITSVEFHVRPPVGAVMVWPAAILEAQAGYLVASHTLILADTAAAGRHVAMAYLYLPSGRIRSAPSVFTVVDPLAYGA